MLQYQSLVRQVAQFGVRKENRTGVDTISTFGLHYTHDMQLGFPLLTTKMIDFTKIVIENLWFLSGSNKSDFLEHHGVKFWRPWYNPDGTVKNCYGPAWRNFGTRAGNIATSGNDQIDWVLKELRHNPMSRRLVVNAWEPDVAQKAPLPPCHAMFILNVQNSYHLDPNYIGEVIKEQKLCLHLTQRSCDMALGVPYNMAGYGFILSLFAHLSGMRRGTFSHTLVDAHIYTCKPDGSMVEYGHMVGLREQLMRTPRQLPELHISSSIKELSDLDQFQDPKCPTSEIMKHFVLEGYDPYPAIKFKVAV